MRVTCMSIYIYIYVHPDLSWWWWGYERTKEEFRINQTCADDCLKPLFGFIFLLGLSTDINKICCHTTPTLNLDILQERRVYVKEEDLDWFFYRCGLL